MLQLKEQVEIILSEQLQVALQSSTRMVQELQVQELIGMNDTLVLRFSFKT